MPDGPEACASPNEETSYSGPNKDHGLKKGKMIFKVILRGPNPWRQESEISKLRFEAKFDKFRLAGVVSGGGLREKLPQLISCWG